MKKIFIAFLFTSISTITHAQSYTVPAASPKQSIEQQFSISTIKLEYSRPAVKGRKIFGELVAFDKVWRVGANAATKIKFNQKIIFGDKNVMPGEYALFVIPQANKWKIILNKDANAWGAYTYNEQLNVAEIEVAVQKLNNVQEFLEIKFEPKNENLIHLIISWDKTSVEIPIQPFDIDSTNSIIKYLQHIKQIQRDINKK